MKKIEKAVRLIKEGKIAPDALEYLTTLKTEFLPRRTSENDVSKLDVLGKLEHSLYRYNELLKAGLKDDAKREGQNFIDLVQYANGENGGVLKGGVSNVSYTWKTEPGACDACLALDGKTFETLDEVPDRPHPNCKCKIEPIEEEPCDCYEKILQLESIIDKGDMLTEKMQDDLVHIESLIADYSNTNSNYVHSLINDLIALEQPYITLIQVISTFLTNWVEMKDAGVKGGDKYFHAKANCEASQRGLLGEVIAEALGNLREVSDNYRNLNEKKMSLEASLKDINEDLKANQEGRDLGHRHPLIDAYDLLKHRIPKGFPERYRKR